MLGCPAARMTWSVEVSVARCVDVRVNSAVAERAHALLVVDVLELVLSVALAVALPVVASEHLHPHRPSLPLPLVARHSWYVLPLCEGMAMPYA